MGYVRIWGSRAGIVLGVLGAALAETAPREIRRGLTYEHRQIEGPLSIHILVADPTEIEITAARALNNGIGRETVSSIAARKGAVAAVNGGFFQMGGRYDGDPAGLLRVERRWFSDVVTPRGAIGWKSGGAEVLLGRASVRWMLQLEDGSLPIGGINRARSDNQTVLYGWDFHRSTLTDPGGWEAQILEGRIVSMGRRGDTPIPPGGYVYSAGPKSPQAVIERLQEGISAKPVMGFTEAGTTRGPEWEQMDHIMGGTPLLIQEGKIKQDIDTEQVDQGFVLKRHPRTAVGILPDGRWVLVVVDGRQKNLSIGMSLGELADFLASLGCVEALNLDGGGSTTIYLEGRVINSPSDSGVERPVSDAILILEK